MRQSYLINASLMTTALLFILSWQGTAHAVDKIPVLISSENISNYGEYYSKARKTWSVCARTVTGEYLSGQAVDELGLPLRLAIGAYFLYSGTPSMQSLESKYLLIKARLTERIAELLRANRFKLVRKAINSKRLSVLSRQLTDQARAIKIITQEIKLCSEALKQVAPPL